MTFKAAERAGLSGKIDIPLALIMRGEYRLDDPASANRPMDSFRIVMEDRELAPRNHRGIRAVMPYVLYNGITSLILDVKEEGDESVFPHDSFWLNVHEPDAPHPINDSLDATLQVFINPNSVSPDELLPRYKALKEEVATILEGVVNTPLATG